MYPPRRCAGGGSSSVDRSRKGRPSFLVSPWSLVRRTAGLADMAQFGLGAHTERSYRIGPRMVMDCVARMGV